MSFHVGDLVVCVDDAPRFHPGKRLVRGRLYSVVGRCPRCSDHIGIVVEEAEAADCCFAADRFCPLDDSNLAIFRQIIAPIFSKEKVATP